MRKKSKSTVHTCLNADQDQSKNVNAPSNIAHTSSTANNISSVMLHSEVITEPHNPNTNASCSNSYSDEDLVNLFLHGRSAATKSAYASDIGQFLQFAKGVLDTVNHRCLPLVNHRVIQEYASSFSLTKLKPATIYRKLSAIKSLFGFLHQIGLLPFDVGKVLRLPSFPKSLSLKYLTPEEVLSMIGMEKNPRNKTLLMVLYTTGCRISEVLSLNGESLLQRVQGGQISVFGKGAKERTVLIPLKVWNRLLILTKNCSQNAPIFRSRTGKRLERSMAWRIVRSAAQRAGIAKNVSPHYYRHAHATHALFNGVKINVLKDSLGHSNIATTSIYLASMPSECSSTFINI